MERLSFGDNILGESEEEICIRHGGIRADNDLCSLFNFYGKRFSQTALPPKH